MAGFQTKTFQKHDDYMTPKSAWEAIKEYIPGNKILWDPFYGDGSSGNILQELKPNSSVIHNDEDFFEVIKNQQPPTQGEDSYGNKYCYYQPLDFLHKHHVHDNYLYKNKFHMLHH